VQLTRLRVFNYRNFREEEIQLSPGTSLFLGRNGQGKTNLLEAIYLLGYGKSFRTATPKDCIRHGENESRVQGSVKQGELVRELQVSISRSGKRLYLHGKEEPLDAFVGNLHLLAFTGEHLSVVRGGPGERRAFLDRAMVMLYPSHLRHLTSYSRALKQRNRVLSGAREKRRAPDEGFLSSWEETLVQDGSKIISNRMSYTERMKEELPIGLFGAEQLEAKYVSTIVRAPATLDAITSAFREKLMRVRDADLRMGFTTVGPHRDELRLVIEGKPLAGFGSAGQQRSALISMYIAQMEIHRRAHSFYPVFLVDDVEAELDEGRLQTFLSYLAERTQTFLTTAKETMDPWMPSGLRRFEVSAGTVRPVTESTH